MKFFLMALVLGVAGYFAWQQFKPKPPPPPPPPAPILLTAPASIINTEEQAKIIKSANDQDAEVRWQAILFLDKMKVPVAWDVMFEKIHKDTDLDLRLKVIKLIGEHGAQKLTILPNPADPLNPIVSACAVSTGVDEKCARDIAQHLVATAQDPIPEIRIAALKSLDTLGDYAVAPAITDSLKDPDERVRIQALKTLNSLQDKKAALIEAERKRQEEERRKAQEEGKPKPLLAP